MNNNAKTLIHFVQRHQGCIYGQSACLFLMGEDESIQTIEAVFPNIRCCKGFIRALTAQRLRETNHTIIYNSIDTQWDILIDNSYHIIVSTQLSRTFVELDIDKVFVDFNGHFHHSNIPLHDICAKRFKADVSHDVSCEAVSRAAQLVKTGWKMTNLSGAWKVSRWADVHVENCIKDIGDSCPVCGMFHKKDDIVVSLNTSLTIHIICYIHMCH